MTAGTQSFLDLSKLTAKLERTLSTKQGHNTKPPQTMGQTLTFYSIITLKILWKREHLLFEANNHFP